MSAGPLPPAERRAYQRGYTAGKRLIDHRLGQAWACAAAATRLFESLVEGLVLQGLTLDAVLDAQIAGEKARFGGVPQL